MGPGTDPIVDSLKKLLQRCAIIVASSPRKYILWPAMCAFVLSYTTLYSLFSPSLPYAPVPQCLDPISQPDLYIRQALITPPVLMQATDEFIEQALVEELAELKTQGLVVSPMTLNVTRSSAPSILYAPKFSKERVTGARGLMISFIYHAQQEGELAWKKMVAKLVGHYDSSAYQDATLSPAPANYGQERLPPEYNLFPGCPAPIITIIIIYSLGALYMAIMFADTESVLSQAGLAVTLTVEGGLAIFAALTVTMLIYPNFSHYHIRPFLALPYIIATVGTENMFRLVNATARTPPENNPLSRISAAVTVAAPHTLYNTLSYCGVMAIGLIPRLGLSSNARALCCFMVLGLLFDMCMHFTFFTAVLSVDLRRLELQDLLSAAESPMEEHQPTSADQITHKQLWHADYDANLSKSLKFHFKAFVYFRRIYIKQKLPALTTALVYGSVLGYLWLMSQGYITNTAQIFEHPSGKFVYFLGSLGTELSEIRGNILVYEPMVLYAKRQHPVSPQFTLGLPLHHALTPTIPDFFSMNLMVEFFASFVFIISLTFIVLKFILPTSIEIPDEQDLSDVVRFFSKDLVGYHSLDILQLVIQGSWVATVSLDHRVHVWNAAQSKAHYKPVSIPIPSDFWPISRIALNSQCIAIFSPISGLFAWSIKKKKRLYHVPSVKRVREAFYSGDTLTFVADDCINLVDPSGELTTVALPGAATCATRLQTPHMGEQIVGVTSENEVFVATNYEGQWSVRVVDLVELVSHKLHFNIEQKKVVPPPSVSPNSKSPIGLYEHTTPFTIKEPLIRVLPLPELHMVVLATELSALILDITTGTIMKQIQVGNFNHSTLKAFHSPPTHCRFCGSPSVENISIAYQDFENPGLVICHTLVIENRARNYICLRAERDARETRCLGFEAASENQHWVTNVEGWDTTDMNMFMGVRRKEVDPDSSSDDDQWTSAATGIANLRPISSKVKSRRHRSVKKPPLNITWEGWAMSANGQVTYYDIPDVQNGSKLSSFANRLLIQSVGPVVKYGRKSIAVAFGNVIKILYFGNEESFLSDAVEDAFKPQLFQARNGNGKTSVSQQGGVKRWRRAP